MKKFILLTILSLFCLQNLSQANQIKDKSNKKNTVEQIKESFLEGEYTLLNFKVKIYKNKEGKLILSIPFTNKFVEEIHDIVLNSDELKLKKNQLILFPIKGDFELSKTSDFIYMVKNTGGFSIEINKNNRYLTLRDAKFEFFEVNNFYELVELYEDIIKSRDEALNSSVIANIHTLQTISEWYALDFNHFYPEDVSDLYKEATKNNYWRSFKNPFTSKTGNNKNGSIINYKDYKNGKSTPSLKGLVIYEPVDCKLEKEYNKRLCKIYKIYGTDKNGLLLKKEEKVFFLSNIY